VRATFTAHGSQDDLGILQHQFAATRPFLIVIHVRVASFRGPFAVSCDTHLTCPTTKAFQSASSSVISPVPSQPPFGVGIHPIQPVSRCLSAAGLRFLGHRLPAGEFSLPCGWLTITGPHRGYYVSHERETIGVGVLYAAGAWCPIIPSVKEKEYSTGRSVLCSCPNIADSADCGDLYSRSLIKDSLAFTRPISPSPGHRISGSQFPWASPSASHPTVTSGACEGWRQAVDTSLKAFASLTQATSYRTFTGIYNTKWLT